MNKKVISIPRTFYARKPNAPRYFSFGSLASIIPAEVTEMLNKKEKSAQYQRDYDRALAERGRRAKAIFFENQDR